MSVAVSSGIATGPGARSVFSRKAPPNSGPEPYSTVANAACTFSCCAGVVTSPNSAWKFGCVTPVSMNVYRFAFRILS